MSENALKQENLENTNFSRENFSVSDLDSPRKLEQMGKLLASQLNRHNFVPANGAHDAEDIVQETLHVAIQKRNQVTNTQNIFPWLLQIARMFSLQKKKIKKRNSTPNDFGVDISQAKTEFASADPDSLEILIAKRGSEAQKKLLRKIEVFLSKQPNQKHVNIWKLRYVNDLDFEAIERISGISRNSLKPIIHRLNKKIQTAFGTEFKLTL